MRLLAASRRLASQRWASVCLHFPYGIPSLFLAWFRILSSRRTLAVGFLASCRIASLEYGGLCRRRGDLRCDAASRFARIVPYWFLSPFLARFNVLRRRGHDTWRRFSSCLWFPCAHIRKNWIFSRSRVYTRRDARRRFASAVSCGLRWTWILSRLRNDRRCDSQRHFASVLSCSFPRLIYALYGILSRRRDDGRCDALRQFGKSFLLPLISSYKLYMEYFVGISTLSVGLWVSCRMASRCSSWLHLELKSALRR
jgi:hypothetical protein